MQTLEGRVPATGEAQEVSDIGHTGSCHERVLTLSDYPGPQDYPATEHGLSVGEVRQSSRSPPVQTAHRSLVDPEVSRGLAPLLQTVLFPDQADLDVDTQPVVESLELETPVSGSAESLLQSNP